MFSKKQHITQEQDLQKVFDELRKGSAEAFKILYAKYQQKIYRFCLRMLVDADTARDAFQETFIKVYEHRREFRGNNFSSWVYTIARHTCLNIIRTRKEYDELNDEMNYSYNAEYTDVGMKNEIEKAIATLPVAMREALVLREYEECSYQEIAEILAIDISLAKVRVHRARLLLRKLLTPLVKEYYES